MKFLDLFKRQASPFTAQRAPLAAALEPRMLFDGAIAATTAETVTSAEPQPNSTNAGDTAQHTSDVVPPAATSDQRQEIVFVDGKVADKQQLIDGLKPGTEVVVLDSSKDGLQQIADYLEGREGIDAIHILSHGDTGRILIGNAWLDNDSLNARSELLAGIGNSLSENGDVLLYGCRVGADGAGTEFIRSFANATGADIAASDDLTGHSTLQGDWLLETQNGSIETAVVVSAQTAENYHYTLEPADQGFDNPVSAPYEFTGPETINGVIYHLVSPAGGTSTITASPGTFSITPEDVGKPYGYDLALVFNLNSSNTVLPGSLEAHISAADGNEFRMVSMEIDTGAGLGTSPNLTIKGYLNGVEVASDTVNTGVSDSTGSVTYTKNGVSLGFGGTLTFNSAWQYIDEIRITGTNTAVAIDDLNFEAAVLPNAAPVVGNLNGDSVGFTEGGSAVLLDVGSNATVTDADSADFSGGSVTVSIVTNRVGGEDVLAIQNQGTGGGQIGVSGSNVIYGGTVIGTVSGGTGSNDLVVSLNANATPTAVQALVRNLTYTNSNNSDPSSAVRTVHITVSDGDGGTSSNANVTVNITPVNDAPATTATGGNPTYTENGSAVDLFSSVSINTVEAGQTITGMTLTVSNLANGSSEILRIDGSDIALINGNSGTTVGNSIGYSISVVGGTATVTLNKAGGVSTAVAQTVVDGMSYRNSSDTPSTATRVVTLTSITDNGGTLNGGVDTSSLSIAATVTVVAVNDAPTVANAIPNQNATEDAVFSFQFASNTFSDVEGNTLTYSALLSGGATLPAWLNFDAATRTFSGTPANGDVGTLTVDVTANDGNGGTVVDTFTIVIANTNDAPTVANTIPNQNATQDAAFNFQFAANTFADVDAGATLSYSALLSGGGSLPAWLSFDAATRTFSGTPANGDVGTLTIDVTANDGNGGTVVDTFTIVIANINDAPTVTISSPNYFADEQVPINLHGTGISVNDIDGDPLTVTLTGAGSNSQLAATVGTTGVVIISGNGTNTLVLTGTVAQLNALFSGNDGATLTYHLSGDTPVATRLLTISASDGSLSGNDTAIVNITAVNDAPVNSLPAAQSVDQDSSLVFNNGNGNLISISDVDAGSNSVRVTLTATNGLLTLGSINGLVFLVGSGTADGTLTVEGSLADINNALNGLTFTPTGGYNGSASLQITSNDMGNSGSGGVQSDTDTLNITVSPINPVITGVMASNGTYGINDSMLVTLTFNQAVYVDTTGGIPSLLLETGSIDRNATYVAGSGSNTLVFSYTVQAGDVSADLDYASTAALMLNGATIQSAGSDNAILTLPTPGAANSLGANSNVVVDGVAATVTSVFVPASTTYGPGQNLDFTVNLSENITVDTSGGTPRIAITLDTGGTAYASYLSGSGTSALVFRLTVVSGQMDSNGISLGSSIDANGGTLRDTAGNNSTTTLNAVGSTTGVLVDAVAPNVSGIVLDGASPTNASSVSFTVTFTEDVSGVDPSDFSLVTSGGVTGTVQSVVQINAHTYQVLVDGITGLGSLGLDLNASGTGITDNAGNASAGAFNGPAYTIGIPVTPPTTPEVVGDPEFRANPPVVIPSLPSTPILPIVPLPPPQVTSSPLIPPPLFEIPTIGSGIPTLGNIFINNGALAPSFIAQVFTSSSSDIGGDGSGSGFLGFGGGDGGVFGSSSLSNIFGQDSLQETEQLEVFDGKKWGSTEGSRPGTLSAPTLGQQLHELHEGEQRQVRELAQALGQFENPIPQA